MKSVTLHQRVISAIMLFAFSVTTISPSLAWAAEREEPAPADAAPTGRVVDQVSSADASADLKKADVPVDTASSSSSGSEVTQKLKPNEKDLKDAAVGGGVQKKPDSEVSANTASDQVQSLPTGGDKSGVTSQAISVPKGSGTIQGMGESFSAQLSTGIATFSVPFSLPAARGGAQPSLGLSYSSASGSGLAGMGWSVGVPYIARQTDRGLPQYQDGAEWGPTQDRFVFNGGQELVPICTVQADLSCAGALTGEVMPPWSSGHQYFRPRVEGSFLRFFWSPDHRTWRVQDKSGVTMELGVPLDGSGDATALEVNPDAKTQIFRWHLVRQYDNYGSVNPASGNPAPLNVVVYKYFQDGGQAYLSDIYDTTPASSPTSGTLADYAHHTHLDYETRSDQTESYRSGWLIQQRLRLSQLDVASKTFNGGSSGLRHLVRRYHLEYDSAFHTSYLTSVQVEGRCAASEDDAPAESNGVVGSTSCDRLPPMTFEYSHVRGFNTAGTAVGSGLVGYEAFDARLQKVGASPPNSIDEALTDYFDINADGLPDVLVTAPGVYGNDYGAFFNSAAGVRDTFGSVQQLGVLGVLGANSGTLKLSNLNVTPLDLDSDGIVDFLHMPQVKTYAAYNFTQINGKWMLKGRAIDVANQQSPKIDLGKDASNAHVMDVNFDGMVDLVLSKGTEFETFYSLGRLPGGDAQFGHGQWTSATTASLSNDPVAKCVPYSGTPVQFSDPDIQLADMNGDGIQDIVRVRRGDLRYWPGRGNGFWGTGKLDDCPAGSFGDKRYLTMDSSPYYSDIQGTSLRLDDVNGDGLDDLVQVRTTAVDVWLNVDGHGWTQRYIIDGTPPSPSYASRVRLMDINGSGTRDVVWGDGKRYQYMDLDGGERPGLLTVVKNGLGKSTTIDYESSTEEMLAAERTGIDDCSSAVPAFESKWCAKMPTVTHLVKRVTESDNLSVAGSGPSQYVTEYSYRDPVYEGRQREFRGFRRARSKRIGDANSPTDYTESTFLLGECEDETPDNGVDDCSLPERWRDNPREALKGLPVVTERYDENGQRLSTALTTYRLRQLYSGLDGRAVRHAFQSSSKTLQYDTAAGPVTGQASSFSAVELETTQDAGFNPQARPLVAPNNLDASNKTVAFTDYSTSGAAVIEGSSVVDYFGNQVAGIDKGCTGGGASTSPDETIYKYTLPASCGTSGWIFRTSRSYATGSQHTEIRGDSTTTYNDDCAPESTSVVLSGTVALDRFHDTAGRSVAPTLSTASQDGTRVLGTREYDAFGNLTEETGPTGDANSPVDLHRCRDVVYDGSDSQGYALLALSETSYSGGCGVGPITSIAHYDRGLGVVTAVTDPNDKITTVVYDQLGRLTQLFRPSALETPPDPPLPAVAIDYSLPSPEDPRAYSIIHTKTQDGADESVDAYMEAYSYVDGMGRARVGLSEADPTAGDAAPWIVSSIAEFDAKGAARRKYLPYFANVDPSVFPATSAPASQYGQQRYDAFGRQLQTFDVDGTVTLQSRYHALSTDLYDAADLYPGPHQGSFASTRTDGHGRTVETTERVHVGGALDLRYVRTSYLATGEPEAISRVHGSDDAHAVMRWMRYDSMGRMVLNVDPHTTGNFTTDLNVDATPSSNGLKAWRYAYDDAGDLVGTSDARGCGENFFYDGAGRLFGEDFSPCQKIHPVYTAPAVNSSSISNPNALASSNGFEIFYQFDASSSIGVTPPGSSDGYTAGNTVGRLVAVHDRAATTWSSYDARGHVIATSRRTVAWGQGGNSIVSTRYSPRWYHQETTYDAADRPVTETTGAQSSEYLVNGQSSVTTHYTKRGTVASVDSSYGNLVNHVQRDAQGLVGEIEFGDAANTTTVMKYDSRRRLSNVLTTRAGSVWLSPPASYQPPPAIGAEDPPSSFQLTLEDLDYKYDVVGNPTEIRDWRTPEEWPAGSKPVSRRMQYDDLYRVTRVDYSYPGGYDYWKSPFAPEIGGASDPRQHTMVGHQNVPTRPEWQTYQYDWLGNLTQSDDDQHVSFDRSLGNLSYSSTKPYQFTGATKLAATTYAANTDLVTYDVAGNLTQMRTNRSEANCVGGLCNQRFFYDWDELGRLMRVENLMSGRLVYTRYAYDASDERVGTNTDYSTSCAPGQCFETLYIFDSLEIRRAVWDSAAGEYPLSVDNEVPYLFAHGMRLGRVVYEPAATGEPRSPDTNPVHVFLELPDHLGSTNIVLDLATSELVEARTYQPYGATESDYRPDRWKGFREDYGFTGKEEDVEVGLQYFGKRYLSPYLGRWISADPLAVHEAGKADLNLYAYVKGAVLSAIDAVGLQSGTGWPETSSWDTESEAKADPAPVASTDNAVPSSAAPKPAPSGPSTWAPSATYVDTGHAPPPSQGSFPIDGPPSEGSFPPSPTAAPSSPSAPGLGGGARPGSQAGEEVLGLLGVGLASAGAAAAAGYGLSAGAAFLCGASVICGGVVTGIALGYGAASLWENRDKLMSDPYAAMSAIAGLGSGGIFSEEGAALGRGLADAADGTCAGGQCPCFVAGTRVDTDDGSKPIEAVGLGDRVGPEAPECGPSLDLTGWRELGLRMVVRSNGATDELDIRLLRPSWWIAEEGAQAGTEIGLSIDDLNVSGHAYVTYLGPPPRLDVGTRCPVTGTVAHTSRDVITVQLATGAPLLVTSHHRLFSADRNDWVAAGALVDGERLQTRDGVVAVQHVDRTPLNSTEVFNLEVIGEHQYFVGEQRVRAHNQYADLDPLSQSGRRPAKNGLTRAGYEYQKHMGRGQLPSVAGRDLDSAGQNLLDELLTNPKTQQTPVLKGNFAGGTRFIGPNNVGATFDSNGDFQYFGIYP